MPASPQVKAQPTLATSYKIEQRFSASVHQLFAWM
jgi:hypothetical protein